MVDSSVVYFLRTFSLNLTSSSIFIDRIINFYFTKYSENSLRNKINKVGFHGLSWCWQGNPPHTFCEELKMHNEVCSVGWPGSDAE